MSDHNFYEIFPTSIATALHRAFGSYLVKHGVAVRHKNDFEELIVSFPNIDEAYPEHFPKFFEGFRYAPVASPETVPETISEPEVKEDIKQEEKAPVEAPPPFEFPTAASIEAAKAIPVVTEEKPAEQPPVEKTKAKPGRKPKAVADSTTKDTDVVDESTDETDDKKEETTEEKAPEGDKPAE